MEPLHQLGQCEAIQHLAIRRLGAFDPGDLRYGVAWARDGGSVESSIPNVACGWRRDVRPAWKLSLFSASYWHFETCER